MQHGEQIDVTTEHIDHALSPLLSLLEVVLVDDVWSLKFLLEQGVKSVSDVLTDIARFEYPDDWIQISGVKHGEQAQRNLVKLIILAGILITD